MHARPCISPGRDVRTASREDSEGFVDDRTSTQYLIRRARIRLASRRRRPSWNEPLASLVFGLPAVSIGGLGVGALLDALPPSLASLSRPLVLWTTFGSGQA